MALDSDKLVDVNRVIHFERMSGMPCRARGVKERIPRESSQLDISITLTASKLNKRTLIPLMYAT